MNKLLMVITLMFLSLSYSQQCMEFKEIEQHNIVLSELDNIHFNATDSLFNIDTNGLVFHESWTKMMTDLATYLKEKGFNSKKKKVRFFSRIYFSNEGKIEYWFYRIKQSDLTKDQKQEFKKLLYAFCKEYTFELSTDVLFSKCGSIIMNR